jgi:HSP20 family protein
MALPVRRRDTAPQPVQRWDPLRELEGLQERMAQLVGNARSGDGDGLRPWVPLFDIEETDDAWIVEGELPGVRPEDVTVELRDNELSISGEFKERERKGILRRRTRRTGAFDFQITLPGTVDAEDIEATLKDGVLTVRVPKSEQARARRITVRPASS